MGTELEVLIVSCVLTDPTFWGKFLENLYICKPHISEHYTWVLFLISLQIRHVTPVGKCLVLVFHRVHFWSKCYWKTKTKFAISFLIIGIFHCSKNLIVLQDKSCLKIHFNFIHIDQLKLKFKIKKTFKFIN